MQAGLQTILIRTAVTGIVTGLVVWAIWLLAAPLRPYWVAKYSGKSADLRRVTLVFAPFAHADLSGSDLRGADLGFAGLQGANLQGANLCRTGIFETCLRGADLTRANLCGANLTGKDL